VRRIAFVVVLASLTGVLPSSCLAVARAAADPLSLPEAPAAASAPLVVSGTAGADVITILQNAGGSLTVTVNGRARTVAAADVPRLVVDGGAGNDTITADAAVTVRLTIFGGSGRDVITDRGAGADYVDGGPGNDAVTGGTGLCQLFGGAGSDRLTLRGATGLMAGGPGADTYAGGSGAARIFAQRGERITSPSRVTFVSLGTKDASGRAPGSLVHVTGGVAFRARVAADMTSLLSIPNGRKVLTALDNAGHAAGVAPTTGGNATTILDPAPAFLRSGGGHGAGSASVVSYNPYETTIESGALAWQTRPPIVGLYHELVHALNAATGTMQPGRNAAGVQKLELQAIGLKFKGIAYRWTPAAAAGPANPVVFTENGCRALLGIARRTAY